MKYILLTKGKQAKVDDECFEFLSQFKWHFGFRGYAYATIKGKSKAMHRMVLNVNNSKIPVDHKNCDKLDNQKHNLRKASWGLNNANRPKRAKGGSSQFKGVHLFTDGKGYTYWCSRIRKNNKRYNLGLYKDEHLAGLMYDFWAMELFGEYARTNFPIVARSKTE